MSVYKTHDRQGKEIFGVDYRDEFGRRKRRLVGTEEAPRHVEAELRASIYQSKAAFQIYRGAANLTLNDTLNDARDLYLSHAPLNPNTRAHQADRIERLIRSIGNLEIGQVTPRLLDQDFAGRARQVSPGTRVFEAGVIKRLFRWLAEQHHIPSSPAEHLDTTPTPGKPRRAISFEEEAATLAAVTARIRCRILCSLDAGLRLGQVLALRRNHLGEVLRLQPRRQKSWLLMNSYSPMEVRQSPNKSKTSSLLMLRATSAGT